MVGRVEKYLLDRINCEGAIHITLIDPEKVTPEVAALISTDSEALGSSAIMIGGTTVVSQSMLNDTVKHVKEAVSIPVILFPNNITAISEYADAIWFMSLLNSADPYFISGAQVLAAPLIRKIGLEAIPLGYVIVGEGGSVGVVGKACPIPYNKPELAVAHALAAEFLGMRFVYLEAGSGASRPVPPRMIKMVKEAISIKLIVGGGIRNGLQAKEAAKSGADIIVTGTIVEGRSREDIRNKLNEVIIGIKEGVKARSEEV
ncbi:MAG: geranylgeranylglyceryl/heptaprenylglyceryl phosphate synthase [Candidatus Bathyarchaeia archaeon]|nr:geranylgeranylglyceryl/heptaprenylglyceryl phosphate synthase [Candidatus Bathyarchaeota archaeon]